jgi:hypothetical protein
MLNLEWNHADTGTPTLHDAFQLCREDVVALKAYLGKLDLSTVATKAEITGEV